MSALVSVCVPVFNGERFLTEALDSIIRQTYPNLEIIVQDDCSTDRTPDILATYSDPRIKVERNEQNAGIVRTLNRAFERAGGEYLRILCHDDRLLPNDLSAMAALFDNYPDAGMCFSRFFHIDEAGDRIGPSAVIPELAGQPMVIASADLMARLYYKYGCLPGNLSTVMLTSRAIQACGAFDPAYLQPFDWDLWLRISRRFATGMINDFLCEVRYHPGQYSKYAYQAARASEAYRILERLDSYLPPDYLHPRSTYRRRVYSLQFFRLGVRLLLRRQFRQGLRVLGEVGRRDNLAVLAGMYLTYVLRQLPALVADWGDPVPM